MLDCDFCDTRNTKEKAVDLIMRHDEQDSSKCTELLVCQKCIDNGITDNDKPGCPGCEQIIRDMDYD